MLPSAEMLTQLLTALTDRLAIEITIRIQPTGKETIRRPGETHGGPPEVDLPHDPGESYGLLDGVGVNGDVIHTLARDYPPERIRQCIVGARRQSKVKNLAGYVIKALKCSYYRDMVLDGTEDFKGAA